MMITDVTFTQEQNKFFSLFNRARFGRADDHNM